MDANLSDITIADFERIILNILREPKLFSIFTHMKEYEQLEDLLLTTDEKLMLLQIKEYAKADKVNFDEILELASWTYRAESKKAETERLKGLAVFEQNITNRNMEFKQALQKNDLSLWNLLLYHNQSSYRYTHYVYRVPGVQKNLRKNLLFLNSQPACYQYGEDIQKFLDSLSLEGLAGSLVLSMPAKNVGTFLKTRQIDGIYHNEGGKHHVKEYKENIYAEILKHSELTWEDVEYLYSLPINNTRADIESFFYQFFQKYPQQVEREMVRSIKSTYVYLRKVPIIEGNYGVNGVFMGEFIAEERSEIITKEKEPLVQKKTT